MRIPGYVLCRTYLDLESYEEVSLPEIHPDFEGLAETSLIIESWWLTEEALERMLS